MNESLMAREPSTTMQNLGMQCETAYLDPQTKELERYQVLFNQSPEGVVVDQLGNLIYANPAMEQLFGIEDINVYLGRSIGNIVAPSDRERVNSITLLRARGQEMPSTYVFTGRKCNGSEFPVEVSVSPINHHNGPATLSILRDISSKQETERALKNANEQLNAIIYTASHDLRSPVVSISGFLGLLKETEGSNLTPGGIRYLERMEGNLERLQRLMDGLLDFSRSGWNKAPWEWVDLDQVLEILHLELEERFRAKGITFEVKSKLPRLYCDRNGLYQVFNNLLTNAIKYMGQQPRPHIEVDYRWEGPHHHFMIADNGIGIDPAFQSQIFEPFQTLQDKRAGEVESYGLGLCIIKRIIDRHHGRIWVESEGVSGSIFHFLVYDNNPDEVSEIEP